MTLCAPPTAVEPSAAAIDAVIKPIDWLVGKTPEELKALMKELGQPAFRAEQLHQWLYVKCERDYERMTNLAKGFKEVLASQYGVGPLSVVADQQSTDGTRKFLFKTPATEKKPSQNIESVLMHFRDRDVRSVCISSQVGCAVDCSFCATGKMGFKQNLTVAEIVDQYLLAQHLSGEEVRNIVFMGQGEPLLNYDNVVQAIRILNQSAEVGIRHITVSTSGIVPKIYQLAEENMQIVLAVSLHAPDDETRSRIMPINTKWPVADLMEAVHAYVAKTKRRVTIEYVMLKGVNDSQAHAHDLGRLLKGLKCNVNLIPYNPIGDEYDFERPSNEAIVRFLDTVMTYGKKVTVRLERGVDIAAACGQLANQYQ